MIEIGPGTVVSDVYEITRLLQRGATSVVWAARHRRLRQKEVAVKILSPEYHRDVEAYERLRREAQILSQLTHPNIVQVYDFDELADGTPYMVVEHLIGETLRERMRQKRMPVDTAVDIARQILSALVAAHHAGVVHRDLNPNNVFLCSALAASSDRELVKVLDFGISTLQGAETVVDATRWVGTPQYMAPEQLMRGERPIDGRADVFAFGAMFYEMLSGRPAFHGSSPHEIALCVVHKQPEPLRQLAPRLPPAVVALVEKALAKDAVQRFQTASAASSALIQATFQPTSAAGQERAPQPREHLWWSVPIAAALALSGVVVSMQSFRRVVPLQRISVDDSGMIAVMEFENQQQDPAQAWYGRALQTAVNSELSGLPQVKVVAPEEIRRIASESGLDSMEAARQLGVRRFVTGSFAVVDKAIRIDARVVDTSAGIQEIAADVEGAQGDFFTLQRRLVRTVLDRFSVRLSPQQQQELEVQPKGSVDKYRMLLDAEGVTTAESDAPELSPQSHRWPSGERYLWATLLVARAEAQQATSAESRARAVLEEYRLAHERGDAQQLASLYTEFSEKQRRAVATYAQNTRDLHIELRNIVIETRETDIRVAYTRRDTFVDGDTGEPMSFEVRLTKFLVQQGEQWRFAAEK